MDVGKKHEDAKGRPLTNILGDQYPSAKGKKCALA